MNQNPFVYLKILDKTNLQVLSHLKTPYTISSLSIKMECTPLIISNSIRTLSLHSLVEKNDDKYNITKLGDVILQKFLGLELFLKYSDYFSSHLFSDIPDFLLSRINDLHKCELVQNVWPTTTRLKEITAGATTFLNCIFTQPPFLLADLIYGKIHGGVKLQLLFGQNSEISDCNDLVEKLSLNKPKISDLFEKRICEHVITNVIVSDGGACLMLGNKNNLTDIQNTLVGYDEPFINWCNDFFDFKWKQGKPFARLRVADTVSDV